MSLWYFPLSKVLITTCSASGCIYKNSWQFAKIFSILEPQRAAIIFTSHFSLFHLANWQSNKQNYVLEKSSTCHDFSTFTRDILSWKWSRMNRSAFYNVFGKHLYWISLCVNYYLYDYVCCKMFFFRKL